jgi:hypothetical protein
MIRGYQGIADIPPALRNLLKNLHKDALGVVDDVPTTAPTRDTLPANYAQFANVSSTRRLYINIDNTIHEIGNITPNNLSITSQTEGSLLYYNATSSWTALASGGSTQILKSGATPAWGTLSLDSLDNVAPMTEAQGDILYHGVSSWTRLAAGNAGESLISHGASNDPTWGTPSVADNVLFNFGNLNPSSANSGLQVGTVSKTDVFWWASGVQYPTIYTALSSKFKKLAGVDTVDFQAYVQGSTSGRNTIVNVSISTAAASAASVSPHQTKQWITGTLDVSGLTDDTIYDLDIQLSSEITNTVKMWNVVGWGS